MSVRWGWIAEDHRARSAGPWWTPGLPTRPVAQSRALICFPNKVQAPPSRRHRRKGVLQQPLASSLLMPSSSVVRFPSSWLSLRTSSSPRLRWVMSLLVSRMAIRAPLLVSSQRPSARHHHVCSISFGLPDLAFPAAGAQQLRLNLIGRHGKDCAQQLVSVLPDRFLCRPPVQLLSAPVPVCNDVAHVTGQKSCHG